MTRRHRIKEAEFEPVYEVLTNELAIIAATNEPDTVPRLKHIRLFHLWWRMTKESPGNPGYPDPVYYGTIGHYVSQVYGTITSDSIIGDPQPVADADPPNKRVEAQSKEET